MNRSKLRENIFKLLYTAEFQEKEEMPQQMSLYFTYSDDNDEDEEVTVSEKDQTYMEEKYHHVTEHIPEIDEMLNRTSEGWKTTRMGKVDLAILRLAVYEMKFDEDVPVGVAINEAVELAKRFGRDQSPSFINGILGKLAREEDENKNQNVYTVGQVNSYIKNIFDQDYKLRRIYVSGEVSNCKYHPSGHIYFSLKDAEGTISCVMFAGSRRGLAFPMRDGDNVIVGGSISVYERDGKYQIYAKEITKEGAGLLYEKYLALKAELEEMGMFAPEYKQPIPAYVKKIGVVTAPTGAAVQDIKNIALRRNPFVQIILYPALVQGEGAADSIVEGIRCLDALNLDVLIVGRGGGSIEDLWAFNEEKVARAVFSCHTPVISAVGHETDTTIIDFVADLRAPTPSAAAELAVADVRAVLNTLENYKSRMNHAMANQTQRARSRLLQYETKWKYLGPENKIRDQRARHAELERRYTDAMEEKLKEARHRLALYIQAMKGLSPLDKLNQGYSYVEKEGKAITSVQDVKEGDLLEICVSDGKITARAEKTSAVSWMEQS